MTDKLQLMLINILLDQFLNIKVSQSSVAMHLRCDGMLAIIHYIITAESESEKFWKSVNICRSYDVI